MSTINHIRVCWRSYPGNELIHVGDLYRKGTHNCYDYMFQYVKNIRQIVEENEYFIDVGCIPIDTEPYIQRYLFPQFYRKCYISPARKDLLARLKQLGVDPNDHFEVLIKAFPTCATDRIEFHL